MELAGNGLIAYSSDGDIHVGDPATGATRPITTSTEFEVNPIFRPDGTRIAFVRGELNTDAVVVVVDTDSSHERVIFPRDGEAMSAGVFSWTPDGTDLLVGADSPDTEYWDGILALPDAAGQGEVRLLTPPLPKSIGALPWNPSIRPHIWGCRLGRTGVGLAPRSRVEMSSTRVTAPTDAAASAPERPRPSAAAHLAIGAIVGLAWAAAFRGFMAGLAGGASTFDWYGTYVAILLPGVIAGAGLGWAEYLRRTGGRPRWRWLALSVLAFAVAPLTMPGAFEALFTQGLGGGAIAVPLAALAGGYALARNGPLWARIACGILATLVLAALAALPFGDETSRLVRDLPRGVWVATLAASCFAVLCIACAIPFRRVDPAGVPPSGERASG